MIIEVGEKSTTIVTDQPNSETCIMLRNLLSQCLYKV